MAIVFTAKLADVQNSDITSSEMYYKGKRSLTYDDFPG